MSVSEKVSLSDALSNVDVLDELTLPGRFCNNVFNILMCNGSYSSYRYYNKRLELPFSL